MVREIVCGELHGGMAGFNRFGIHFSSFNRGPEKDNDNIIYIAIIVFAPSW
jgi:hypothetical protein